MSRTTTKPTPKKPKPKPSTSKPKIPKLDPAELRTYVAGLAPDPAVVEDNVARYRDQLAKAKTRGDEQTVKILTEAIDEFMALSIMLPMRHKPKSKCRNCQGTLRRHNPQDWFFQCDNCKARFVDPSCLGPPATRTVTGDRLRVKCQNPSDGKRELLGKIEAVACQPGAADIWRPRIRAFTAKLAKVVKDPERAPKDWVIKPGHKLPELLGPGTPLTIDAKFFVLAAFHDRLRESLRLDRIMDWNLGDDLSQSPDLNLYVVYMTYGDQCVDRTDDEILLDVLEKCLADVKGELPSAVEPDGADTSGDATGEVPWEDGNLAFETGKKTIEKYDEKKIDATNVAHLDYDNLRRFVGTFKIAHMRRGQRLKVHAAEFERAFKKHGRQLAKTAATPEFLAMLARKSEEERHSYICSSCDGEVVSTKRPSKCEHCGRATMVLKTKRRGS